MGQIYCGKCKWYEVLGRIPGGFHDICRAPKNYAMRKTYYGIIGKAIQTPSKRNKFNNCMFYEPR